MIMNIASNYIYSFLAGYLSGSILFAWVVTKIVTGKNIREQGGGNPGVVNVINIVGKKWGILTAILDLLKVIFPLLIARYFNLGDACLILISIGSIIGHLYPVYFRFRGGKGVACVMGSYFVLFPYEALISILISILIFSIKKSMRERFSFFFPITLVILSYIISFAFIHSLTIRIGMIAIVLTTFLNRKNRSNFLNILEKLIKKKGGIKL